MRFLAKMWRSRENLTNPESQADDMQRGLGKSGAFMCVAGMHRSGTSVLTRIAELVGVDIGPHSRLLETRPDNPMGYWENRDITRLNDALLRMLGSSWDAPPRLTDGWENSAELDVMREKALLILEELFQGRRPAAWKDPRMSLLLPFWRTVADIDPVVMLVRHPAQVAASLHARDGIDLVSACDLWTRYTADCWANSENPLILHFDDIYTHPTLIGQQVAERLGLSIPTAEVETQIRAAVDPGLRHHSVGKEQAQATESATRLYELLQGSDDVATSEYCSDLRSGWS